MPERLIVVVRVPGHGLTRQGSEEQDQEDDREAVLPEEPAHQLCRNPMTEQNVIPTVMRTR